MKNRDASTYEQRAAVRMDEVDNLPADHRKIVHDWGFTIYRAFTQAGVKKANHMRHIVETVLNETRGKPLPATTKAFGSSQFGNQRVPKRD